MSLRLVAASLLAAVLAPASGGADAPVTAAVLRERLLALNRPKAPYRIVDGASEGKEIKKPIQEAVNAAGAGVASSGP